MIRLQNQESTTGMLENFTRLQNVDIITVDIRAFNQSQQKSSK